LGKSRASQMKKWIQNIREFILARWEVLRERLNKIRPRFLGGAGLADVLVFFFQGMGHRRFTLNAMAMAYRFFFAIFPALILIFTLVPIIPIPELRGQVTGMISAVVPSDSMGFMDRVVNEFFSKPSAGLVYVNIILLFFSTMSGIKVMMSAFSKDSHHFRQRNVLHFNFVAFILLLGLLVIFLGTIGLLVGEEVMVNSLKRSGELVTGGWEHILIGTIFWILMYSGLLFAVSLLYYLGPDTHKRGRFFSPGSIAGSVLILLAVTAFRLFFAQFANYNKVYGSLSAIMVLMVWFYWISIVLLIGFELNAAILAASSKMVGGPDANDGVIERRREGETIDEKRSRPKKHRPSSHPGDL
jgi:membrane protein